VIVSGNHVVAAGVYDLDPRLGFFDLEASMANIGAGAGTTIVDGTQCQDGVPASRRGMMESPELPSATSIAACSVHAPAPAGAPHLVPVPCSPSAVVFT
jgi:hypothetical protein